MKWQLKRVKNKEWNRWYAWFPVVLNDEEWVWLEWVLRRKTLAKWDYTQ